MEQATLAALENHGLLFWTLSREQWIGNKSKENLVQQVIEPRLSSDATYDSVLGRNEPLSQPIPLSEMVRLSFGHVGAGGDQGCMISQKTCQMTLETGLLFARPPKSVVI